MLFLKHFEKEDDSIDLDPRGFCYYWSLWYLDLRLTNPLIKRNYLITQSIKHIKSNNIGFKKFIRSYAIFINTITMIFKKKLVNGKMSLDNGTDYLKFLNDTIKGEQL
jgi:hypothetical protein